MTRWVWIIAGLVAGGGAIYEFAAGSGWFGFWLVVLAAAALLRLPARSYWSRVMSDDPAGALLQSSWFVSAMVLGVLLLGLADLSGVGLRKNVGRGVLAMIAAAAGGYALVLMRREIGRIRTKPLDTTPLTDRDPRLRDLASLELDRDEHPTE